MALVIRPRNECEEIYLDALMEVLKERGILCGKLSQPISLHVGNSIIDLNKGTYIILYKNKPEVVEGIGIDLKRRGYDVYSLDSFTLSLLLYLK